METTTTQSTIEKKTNTAITISIIALAIGIFAVILAWSAYNEYGDTVGEDINQSYEAAVDQLSMTAKKIETRSELLALRAELQAEKTIDNVDVRLADIQTDISELYTNAKIETTDAMQDIDADFEKLEMEIRDGSANSVDTISDILDRLETDLRTDEK